MKPMINARERLPQSSAFTGLFHIQSAISSLPGGLGQVQYCTWLGLPMAAPGGRNAARGKRPGGAKSLSTEEK